MLKGKAYDILLDALAAAGVPCTLHQHEPIINAAEAVGKVAFPPEQFLKTVAFRLKDGRWALAALRPRDRVDYRKLAAVLGVSRRDLLQASPAEVEDELGFQVGGVCPISTRNGVVIVFDQDAVGMGVVYCGSGRSDHTPEIEVSDLMGLSEHLVAPITTDQ